MGLGEPKVTFSENAVPFSKREGYVAGKARELVIKLFEDKPGIYSENFIAHYFGCREGDIPPEMYARVRDRIIEVAAHYLEALRTSHLIPDRTYKAAAEKMEFNNVVIHDAMHTAISYERCAVERCAEIGPLFLDEEGYDTLEALQEEIHALVFTTGFSGILTKKDKQSLLEYLDKSHIIYNDPYISLIEEVATEENFASTQGIYKIYATVMSVWLSRIGNRAQQRDEWLKKMVPQVQNNPEAFLAGRIGRVREGAGGNKLILVEEFMAMTANLPKM